jgi:hypothetical protein
MMAFGAGLPPPPLQAPRPKTANGTIRVANQSRHTP